MSKQTAEAEQAVEVDLDAETAVEQAERRRGDRRRQAAERRTGLERRRGPGRRKSDDRRAAEEGEMTDEQFEFLMAIDTYKRVNKRPFPSWTEVLEILKALGYRRVAEPMPLDRRMADDLDLFLDE
jgi:hypothetical protein